MCQVCENPYRICQWGNTGFYINKMENGEYRFKMEYETIPHKYDISYSTPISYCPYCGRDLTTEVEPPQTYWEYLESLDSKSEEWKIIFDLGKKWHDSGKNLDYELMKYMKW